MSNFKNVSLLNAVYGRNQTDHILPNWDELETQLKLVREEFEEIEEAFKNRDFVNLAKEIGDLLVVTYGLSYVGSIDADELMDIIHESNMSKVHASKNDAVVTCEYYQSIGVTTYYSQIKSSGHEVWVVKSLSDCIGTDGKYYTKDKVVKGINYQIADVSPSIRRNGTL